MVFIVYLECFLSLQCIFNVEEHSQQIKNSIIRGIKMKKVLNHGVSINSI